MIFAASYFPMQNALGPVALSHLTRMDISRSEYIHIYKSIDINTICIILYLRVSIGIYSGVLFQLFPHGFPMNRPQLKPYRIAG